MGPGWPLRGGIARTTSFLAGALHARRELAGYLVPRRQYPRWLYPGGRDEDPAACPRFPFAEPAFSVLEPWSWAPLRRRLRALAPDAIVMPYWTWAWAPVVRFVAAGRVAPMIAIAHNPVDHNAAYLARVAAAAVFARCAGILAHARSVADELRAAFPAAAIAVHPLPPDSVVTPDRDGARARLGLLPHQVAMLCFGLIRPYKGVEVLLDAVEAIKGDDVVLLLAGEPWGDLGARLRARLADERLQRRVVARLGWVPEDQAPMYFAAADAVVLPYLSATGSAVAARALGAGLPIVASAVGGLVDVIEDGENGLLVAPGDPRALREALERMRDGDLRRRLAAGTRAWCRRWSWESYAETLRSLVGRVTSGDG